MSEWIKCSERLPEDGEFVLVCNDDGDADCPIKGVLPDEHGDLIDRDALKKMTVYSPELHEYIVPVAYVDWQKAVIAAERKDDGTTAD